MMFVQALAVAATCPDYAGSGRPAQQACAQEINPHHAADDAVCASEFLPSNQVPASDALALAPAPGPVAVAVLWPPTPQAQAPRPSAATTLPVPAPRFLTFGRLLH